MKKHLITTVAPMMLTGPGVVQAETRYVSDELRVPLRKTPCSRCAILHHGLKAGTPLNIVEINDEGWARVTTNGGLDGWLPSQYLVTEQIAKYRIINVEKKLGKVQSDNQQLREKLAELTAANSSLDSQLQSAQSQSSDISDELNNIRKISANAISIHQQNEELLTKNRILQGEIDILSATNEQLRSSDRQSWFMYGAMAVVMGALLTVLIPRLKRKKKFSEWG